MQNISRYQEQQETFVYMESFKLNSSFSSMILFRKWDINVNCEFIIALSRMNFGKRIFKSVLSVHLKLHLFGMSSLWLIAKQQGPDSPLKLNKRGIQKLNYILPVHKDQNHSKDVKIILPNTFCVWWSAGVLSACHGTNINTVNQLPMTQVYKVSD